MAVIDDVGSANVAASAYSKKLDLGINEFVLFGINQPASEQFIGGL